MISALDVARYLLHLNNGEIEPELITHMRLQKLLYYCQGWRLAFDDEPLFSDRIEAWAHGPVVPSVYPVFADYGNGPILPHEGHDPATLHMNDKALVGNIWHKYKKHSAAALRGMTHAERPWLEARGTRGPDEPCTCEIKHDAMRGFFAETYDRTALPGLDAESLRRRRREFREGHGISFEQLREELNALAQ
jgi:uncharacterized phage-associated protein